MGLKILLYLHAILTCTAGVVLVLDPGSIPHMVGILVDKSQYLICYLLGAAEMAIAFLSFRAARGNNETLLQVVCESLIIFHTLTAAVECIAWFSLRSHVLAINIVARIVIATLFFYYGIMKQRIEQPSN